jgi:hypothetical protein
MNNCSPFLTGRSIIAATNDELHEIAMVFGAQEWFSRLIIGRIFDPDDTF